MDMMNDDALLRPQAPQPATGGIITTQFIDGCTTDYAGRVSFGGCIPSPFSQPLVRKQTPEGYANLFFEPDSAKWLIAFAAFIAGRNA